MKTLLARAGRALLRVFPESFRDRFGDDIAEYFVTRSREVRARRGITGMVGFWLRGAVDVVRAAAAERREEGRMRRATDGAGGHSDLGLDARFALRGFRRAPGFTLAVLLTLALGIGATTAMFSVLDVALRRALPYPEADRLVMGRATFEGRVNPWAAFPDYMDYRDQAGSLESLATIGGGTSLVTITGAGEPEQAALTFVTANLFATLGVNPVLGRTFTVDELPQSGEGQVVISHDFWQRWFGGDPDAIGRSLTVDGGPLTVMGVMPPGFRFMYDSDLWLPPWPGNSDPVTRRYHNWLLVGRLGPGVTLASAQVEVDGISTRLQEAYPDSNRDKALQLDGLRDVMVEGQRSSLLLLMGAIVLVLLIACGNVASLLMARASTRTSELAVRAAMGAGRLRLTRQLLVECLVLALVAGGIGTVLAVWLQNAILAYVSLDLLGVREAGLSWSMLLIALSLTLGTVMLFGVVPSLSGARTDPAKDLREGSRGATAGRGSRFRSGLVVVQVALSLVLLVGAGLLVKSFARLLGVDPGFRVENLLTATVSLPSGNYDDSEARIQFFETLEERIESLPGVQSVGLVNRLPFLQPSGNLAIWAPERPPETNMQTPWADRRIVLPGYFETMGIPLVEGRVLDADDVEGTTPVIVLTRSTAEAVFPGEPVIGRQVGVDMGGAEAGYFEVVGVVEDFRGSSLAGELRPAMFFAFAQVPTSTMRLAVATAGQPMSLVRPIQERIWELDRNIVLSDTQSMEEALSASVADVRSVTTVLGIFAAVAIALATLGLYGVLAYFVSRRTHEIGIRVALGASARSVLQSVVVRGMLLVAMGLTIGVAGAMGAARFARELLDGMLFQTSATDPVTFVSVTGLFLAVALGACLIPAWRALRVDPVEAFRAE